MSFWDEEEDTGDVPEFDPAKSPLRTEDPNSLLHLVLKRMYLDHYDKEHHGQLNSTKEIIKNSFGVNFMMTEHYVEALIRHYYKSKLPYEDDLEPVNKKSFPSNKELKRFLKKSWYLNDWDTIDRYCDSQPSDENKKEQLKDLQNYFKLLKKKILEYYPQLENLPSRGFKELERSLYTINYIFWTDLQEAVERHLGINKEYYEEADRQLAQKRKEREERKKVIKNEGESWLETWEKMTDEEKAEREKLWEERDRLNERAIVFADKVVEQVSKKFIELNSHLNLPYQDFLAKAIHTCRRTYYDTFYIVLEMVEHFKTSDEPFKEEYSRSSWEDEHPFFDVYKRMKEKNVPGAVETFLECLDDDGKIEVYFEINKEGVGNILLSNTYEVFPAILNFTPDAMNQIKDRVFSLSRFNVKELYDVRDRILNVGVEYAEEWDRKIEEYQRKKFEGLE